MRHYRTVENTMMSLESQKQHDAIRTQTSLKHD